VYKTPIAPQQFDKVNVQCHKNDTANKSWRWRPRKKVGTKPLPQNLLSKNKMVLTAIIQYRIITVQTYLELTPTVVVQLLKNL